MQFYIIHNDPATNAKLLPDYAIKSVNCREGWQMLSDIGYTVGVTWTGQNKEYNRYHPNTWRYWKSREDFEYFWSHYVMCLVEYMYRFDKKTIWHKNYNYAACRLISEMLPPRSEKTDTHAVIEYMLMRKIKHFSKQEVNRLWQELNR